LLEGVLEYCEKNRVVDVNIASFNKTNLKEMWREKVFLIDIKPEKLGVEAVDILVQSIEAGLTATSRVVDIEV
ncbi:MAG: hypothetical protein ACRCW5_08480, partial [Cetobacterium sp.]